MKVKLLAILIGSILITGCSVRSINASSEKIEEAAGQIFKAAVKFSESDKAKELADKVLTGFSNE